MKTSLSIFLAFALAASPLLLAQRGGGGGQQQNRGASVGAGRTAASGTLDRTRDQMRQLSRQRLHAQATSQQRDRFRTCDQAASQTRSRAQAIAKESRGGSFNAMTVRREQAQLQKQVRTMAQDHMQFMKGLGAEQQNAVKGQNKAMLQEHERIQNRIQKMEQELSAPNPNRKRVAEQARAIEREMKTYQKHLRTIGDELGLRTR